MQVLDEYVMIEVIQTAWTKMIATIPTLTSFESLVRTHEDYLRLMQDRCFISKGKTNRVMTTLDQIFGFVLKLCQLVREYGADIATDTQAKADF